MTPTPSQKISHLSKHTLLLSLLFALFTLMLLGLSATAQDQSEASDGEVLSFTNTSLPMYQVKTFIGKPARHLPMAQAVQEDPDRPHIRVEAWPYSNASPSYYSGSLVDQPYFVFTLKRDGSTIASCRKDVPVYDTCSGGSLTHIDRDVDLGGTYTYSANIRMYERDQRCPDDGSLNDYCGANGTLLGTGPTLESEAAYIGTENTPRMDLSLSYQGQVISSGFNNIGSDGNQISKSDGNQIPTNDTVTASWYTRAGDGADSCEVYQYKVGSSSSKESPIATVSGSSGSTTLNVGSELGKYRIYLKCENLSEGDGSASKRIEVVSELPPGYYDGADPTGGGGSAIAIPNQDVETDNENENLTNVFSETSGSYVSMMVAGCATESAGFSDASDRDDQAYSYPFGVMSFTLNCEEEGATAEITKHYYTDANPADAVLRKYNTQTDTYTNVSNASIQQTTHNGKTALEVTYSVTDGGALDEDGEANGVIVDPVALGINDIDKRLETDCTEANLSAENCGIIRYILVFANALSVLVGIVVVMMIIIGGIQYSSAANNPQAVAAAKKKISQALLALVIYLFMFAFLQWIIPGGVL